MCTHGRYITNRYTHQQFWCTCGKCKSCQQEKASARSSRIRAEYDGKSAIYFCTLTYDRMSCPYFKIDDLNAIRDVGYGSLPIYRGHDIYWDINKQKYIKTYAETLLSDVPICTENLDDRSFYFKFLKHQFKKVGVCYFRDLQNFEKRFRERLRRSGFREKIRFFNVVEYGGKSLRPHAHFLLFTSPGYDEILRSAFVASWPFGRRVREKESFQLVRDDPAGYVSSYVNGGNSLCEFLASNFKAKHSASKYFGHGRKQFDIYEIEKGVKRGCLDYSYERVVKGVPTILSFPVPKYVVNRWFPLFKGYSRLTSSKVFDYLRSGFQPGVLGAIASEYDWYNEKQQIKYTSEDLRRIGIRFRHCYEKFLQFYPHASFVDYAKAYEATWRVYKSTCYRYFVLDPEVDDFFKYDNICLLPLKRQVNLFYSLGSPSPSRQFIVDNNEKPHYKNKSIKMAGMFDKYCKQKYTTNFVLMQSFDDF